MLSKKESLIIISFVLYISSRPPFLVVNIAIILLFLFLVRLHFKYSIDFFDKYTVSILIIYPIISFTYFLIFNTLEVFLSIRMFLLLIMSTLILKLMRYNFLFTFEKLLYFLTIISLIFYPLQLLAHDKTLTLVSNISQFNPLTEQDEEMKNFLIWGMDVDSGIRNSGFAWEPKAFVNFLILGLIIRLIQNNLNIKDKRILIYTLAVITTLSTTGFLILFGLIPLFILFNKSPDKFFKYLIPVTLIFIYIMQLDFMWNKIKMEWEGRYEYESLLSDSRTFSKRSLGRTPSMIVDLIDFSKQPILGFGLQRDLRTQSVYTKLVRVNGLTDWIASFGIIGIILFIFGHYYGFKKYLSIYNLSGASILVVIIAVIYFATTVTTHLFWLCLMFLFTIQLKK